MVIKGASTWPRYECQALQESAYVQLYQYQVNNQISSIGVLYLSSAEWKCLTGIGLCTHVVMQADNKIGVDGVKHLLQARWNKHVKELWLGLNVLI